MEMIQSMYQLVCCINRKTYLAIRHATDFRQPSFFKRIARDLETMSAPPAQGQMDIPVIVKRFKSYVLSECRDQLMVIMAHSDETKHFGVHIRFLF